MYWSAYYFFAFMYYIYVHCTGTCTKIGKLIRKPHLRTTGIRTGGLTTMHIDKAIAKAACDDDDDEQGPSMRLPVRGF